MIDPLDLSSNGDQGEPERSHDLFVGSPTLSTTCQRKFSPRIAQLEHFVTGFVSSLQIGWFTEHATTILLPSIESFGAIPSITPLPFSNLGNKIDFGASLGLPLVVPGLAIGRVGIYQH
ncbi:hypothetical protein TWF506_005701 [Arthrobotrys conoides]|uniref:Uncharacterized protein n=1 Tax=Arthrobotrys conoides TaxID=74498 RepID=A0AAN8NPS0_9PEZI